jgi:hypothetical protein
MMILGHFVVMGIVSIGIFGGVAPLLAQSNIPGAAGTEMVRNLRPSGQPVVPLFDGWYVNPDGSHGLCFGYFNLNLEEELEIPLGPDNFIEPARYDGNQPTHFRPVPSNTEGYQRRYYCVLSVTLPPGSETERVVWTLRIDGESYSVPGHIQAPDYLIEEPDQPGRNSVAPLVRFLDPAGPEGRGRHIPVRAGPFSAEVGDPFSLRISVGEPATDNPNSGFDRVRVLWAKHQGPGEVTFEPTTQTPIGGGVEALTKATFDEAGDYVLRLQTYEGSNPWGAQCCWTNAFVEVIVNP